MPAFPTLILLAFLVGRPGSAHRPGWANSRLCDKALSLSFDFRRVAYCGPHWIGCCVGLGSGHGAGDGSTGVDSGAGVGAAGFKEGAGDAGAGAGTIVFVDEPALVSASVGSAL